MKIKLAILALTVLFSILSACYSSQNPTSRSSLQLTFTSAITSQNPPAPTLPLTSTSTESATSAAETQRGSPTSTPEPAQLTQYELSANLNYAQHHLSVDEQIDYINHSSAVISELLLVVEPSRYPGVFQLNSLTWSDGRPITDYTREIGLLRIPLEDVLQPGDRLGLSINFDLNLPSPSPSFYGRPVPFGYSSRQTNLVDWYPFIPPYISGEGWLAHNAGPFGEHLVYEVADFEVSIQLSDSNPALLIAASAPAEVDNEWHRYRSTGARNFSWSVSDQYKLSTTTIDSVVVLAYYFPYNAEAGEAVLQTTAEALALYNELFGPYPRNTLSVVEADFLDGMEYDGLYFLSKGFYNLYSGGASDYLTAIAAHETAHQWWYSLLGNDQALEPWLDEALSTYSERLYYEYKHPEGLDWWWKYRIYYYEPQGWVDGSIYNPQGYRAYRDAVYLNGALFLEDLRNLIGAQAFFTFLHAYTQEYSRQIVSADDFFSLLSEFSPADLSPLLEKYFNTR